MIYSFDTTTPAGTDSPSVIDNRIREVKEAVQERENVDHYWPLTGTQVSDADAGKHRQVTFRADITTPTKVTDEAHLYQKSGELFWQDDTNTEIQLTVAGKLSMAALSNLLNNVFLKSVNVAGTGTINLIKGGTGDKAVIADGALFETSAAPTVDAGIANKKYVDDQIDASIGTGTFNPLAYTGGESITFPNGLIIKHGYKVRVADSTTITFGAAFPTSCVSFTAMPYGANKNHPANHVMSAISASAVTLLTEANDFTGWYWQAMGY